MPNYENRKEELIALLSEKDVLSVSKVTSEVRYCQASSCTWCLFGNENRPCRELRREWLNGEAKEEV